MHTHHSSRPASFPPFPHGITGPHRLTGLFRSGNRTVGKYGRLAIVLILTLAFPVFVRTASAQSFELFEKNLGNSGKVASPAPTEKLTITPSLVAAEQQAGAQGTLSLSVTIPKGYALYSMDPSYAGRTKITVQESPGVELLGEFTPDHPPKREFDSLVGQELEKFTGSVTWSAPVRITNPKQAATTVDFVGTYCSSGANGQCLRANETLTAKLKAAGAVDAFSTIEAPQVAGQPGPAMLRFSLAPRDAAVGSTVTLSATMTLADGWHTYATNQAKGPGVFPTSFQLEKSQGLTPIGETFLANQEPHKSTVRTDDGNRTVLQHSGTVVWSRQFRVDAEMYGVSGSIRYTTCDDSQCLPPKTSSFSLGDISKAGLVPVAIPSEAETPLTEEFQLADLSGSLTSYLLLAFVGGLLLNVMPCVLPVVAIKVMSFVQQAGEDRKRIFILNAVYALGVISVFFFMACLAALPESFAWFFNLLGLTGGDFNWGKLFQSGTFNVVMAALVFTMGLSLLGIYEIPIPGMIGSAAGAAHREGLTGAFLTGIFTTLLATPCGGPYFGSLLPWSLKQPIHIIFLVWIAIGVGMASPYLVFGLFPSAVKLLPKPGVWMLHVKQFAGFILLGTVIYLMMSLNSMVLIPFLIALLGLALALWMFGLVQSDPSAAKRRLVMLGGVLLGSLIIGFGYSLTVESEYQLAWEPFSTERVNKLRSEGKTVLIDFTADWCPNCKLNEHVALNTAATKDFVEEHDVVTLVADFTDESDEIKQWLRRFQKEAIPLTVIFPAGRPNQPIVLDGVYSQSTLLENLQDAVQQQPIQQASQPPGVLR